MKIKNLPDVLTPQQLYTILPIGKNAIYRLINNGTIKSVKVGRKHIITKQSLLDFLEISRYNGDTRI